MEKYGIGTKVYYDTFAGILKGIVTGIDGDKITFKITTTNNNCYKRGEIISASQAWVFPRNAFHKFGLFGFRLDEYIWESK